ncbi:hypothetical protein [Oleiagrimonas sp. C23AA]|uniref:COG4705 family protein n=1 Tax=Oleiagrimonas sp. C23AA TaxID=2719047 RepID=UPI0031B71F87
MSKVPALTLGFWIIKILATTLGETGGDALSMSAGLGYLLSTALFAAIFIAAVAAQIRAREFQPWLYWFAILASTTVGTTLADFADRSLGIGYAGGASTLLALLLVVLALWRWTLGSINVKSVCDWRTEGFYWLAIMCSQTLGTALGDWTADSAGLGYLGAIVVFGGALLMVLAAWRWSRLSTTALFWVAFVLTRPLGAVVGDFLDKPLAQGGLDLSRVAASAILLVSIAVLIAVLPKRAADSAH